MKLLKNILIWGLISILFTFITPSIPLLGEIDGIRHIKITRHDINVSLNQDGSMDVEEYITYAINGIYSGVYQDIGYNNAESVSDIEVFYAKNNNEKDLVKLRGENSIAYRIGGNPDMDKLRITAQMHYEKSSYKSNGAFIYADYKDSENSRYLKPSDLIYSNKLVRVMVYSPSVKTEKTFVYKYKVNKAVTEYSDASELYWKFISSYNTTANKNITLRINIPENLNNNSLKYFSHAPSKVQAIRDSNSLIFKVGYLQPKNFFEVRTVFTNGDGYFYGGNQKEGNLRTILSSEEGYSYSSANASVTNYSTRSRGRHRINIFSLIFTGLNQLAIRFIYPIEPNRFSFSLFAFIFSFVLVLRSIAARLKEKSPLKPQGDYDYFRELPGDYSPAVAGLLIKGNTDMDAVSATILELVRKRILNITPGTEVVEGVLWNREIKDFDISLNIDLENNNEIKPHEKYLLDWFINDFGDFGKADLGNIQQRLKKDKQLAKKFKNKFDEWSKLIFNDAKEMGFVTENDTSENMIPKLIMAAVLIALNPITPILILAAALSYPIDSRTVLGIEHFYKWKAFRKFIRDFSLMDEAEVPSIIIWERYLVYAVALGDAKKAIKNIKVNIPAEAFNDERSVLLNSSTGFAYTAGFISFNDFVSGFESSTNISSSGGSGGSGGGGGGGGGGF